MTVNHRAEAERLLDQATDNDGDIVCDDSLTTTIVAVAQVHATLAASEDPIRAALATLAERYEEIADRAPKHPEYLYIDPLTPAQRAEHDRAHAYRQAAADIRDVLRTGHVPHGLMTDAELEQYGTRDEQPPTP
jgi:hypothetical protein